MIVCPSLGPEGKVYALTGPEFLSYAEMVQKMGVIIGKPLKLVDVPEAAAREGMVAAGVPPSQADGLLRYFKYGVQMGQIYPLTPTVAELLGHPARTFDEWVQDNAAALQ